MRGQSLRPSPRSFTAEALIDSPHTFLEVTCPWEQASLLMTGENTEEEAIRGSSNHTVTIIHLLLALVFICVCFLKRSIISDDTKAGETFMVIAETP